MTETARHSATASSRRERRFVRDPLDPVMQSLAGIIGEGVGLIGHLAALGIGLVSDTMGSTRQPAATPRPALDAPNIIRFPTRRNAKHHN
ncbi:hypothetical protein JQ616_05400 [Bradyrhizobium tropiciagri]|uniref:hypothetical protein n=1 Tax=Bradyrhizobium tropiciagri TaxID=312253 RepID=UPI001BAC2F25|nr:hypothetical protein [Bradyrhizobium tropiciagri]MBR0894379.1 hypothetical protein [Bradyrhizobium tropiciagri]